MTYQFYLDGLLLPVAPSKVQLSINNKNKTITLINDNEINLLKKPGLSSFEFEALLPNVKYPFAFYESGFKPAEIFIAKLKELKINRKPFVFVVTRSKPNGTSLFGTSMQVSLEDYKVKEDANEGLDITVSIKLKEYKDFGFKPSTIKIKNGKAKIRAKKKRAAGKSPMPKKNKKYTVKKGDSLWGIAKYFYGDGSKYSTIAKANKGKISVLMPGQVLIIPKI